MCYLIVTILYVLLVYPIGVSAQIKPPPIIEAATKEVVTSKYETNQECQKSDLAIMGNKDDDKNFLFRLGDTLKIKATGVCFYKIRSALEKSDAEKAFKLHIDDVPMVDLPVDVSQPLAEKALILSFHLKREPNKDENRKPWDKLLEKQHGGYVMKLPVALAIGSDPAWTVSSPSPFQLYVAEGKMVLGTIAVSLLIFLVVYVLLIRNRSTLRDMKDGCYSLGKSQMAFWGLLVVLTFIGIWVLTGTMERIPTQVLTLLGISGATGLSSILIRDSKKSGEISEREAKITKLREEQQKLIKEQPTMPGTSLPLSKDRLTEIELEIKEIKDELDKLSQERSSSISQGFFQDICNDGNGMSFHRFQVVIWTVVLGAVFVRSVTKVMSMPEFPETLLILMGISNGIYLGFKFPEKS